MIRRAGPGGLKAARPDATCIMLCRWYEGMLQMGMGGIESLKSQR